MKRLLTLSIVGLMAAAFTACTKKEEAPAEPVVQAPVENIAPPADKGAPPPAEPAPGS